MRTTRTHLLEAAAAASLLVLSARARADDVLHVGTATLDPPTVTALGVQLLVTGDDNYNAQVTVRYRKSGASAWKPALPLWRVHPDVVTGRTVPPQLAGSIFDLVPGTAYDIELHAVDPDGGVDQTVTLAGTTRPVPSAEPTTPHAVAVANVATLNLALSGAKAGDVITLADGTYAGNFSISASGTSGDPIVIRGTSQGGTILDGGGCDPCNVLEVYGSFVHIERLTLAHASRALRFQGQGAEGNVVRRVHIQDVVLGIGSKADQKDFYLCDNVLEGRLAWPSVYADDGGLHSNDDGIHVEGNGHVVCHNEIRGYGDAMKTAQDGARAIDFYGNEILSAYDNGLELDGSEGNGRCIRNRFTNTYATLSFQPIFGGPAYALRNVIVNVANEQMKFHALGTTPPEEPSGILVYHNTFVSPNNALANYTNAASHHFVIENNLFVASAGGRTVDWTGTVDDGTFDYNGYAPDGVFDFTWGTQGYVKYTSLANARSALGIETHGLVLTSPIFASGLVAPTDYRTVQAPADVSLASGSNAIDRGLVLPNVNDGYTGSGPDLGALELGCPAPIYGPRPEGVDETNEPLGCGSPGADAGTDATTVQPDGRAVGSGGSAGAGGSAAADGSAAVGESTSGSAGSQTAAPEAPSGESSGCGCSLTKRPIVPAWLLLLLVAVVAAAARRRTRPRTVPLALFGACIACVLLFARMTRAEQGIIKVPGAHPHYSVDLEPHLLVGLRDLPIGPGVGLRATIPIVFNGFVSSINDSVGIGFGLDIAPIGNSPRVVIPIVMQWNFWLSTHWSVFGEPGIALAAGRGDSAVPWPVILAGGRYLFTDSLALMFRAGYPSLSVGLSILF